MHGLHAAPQTSSGIHRCKLGRQNRSSYHDPILGMLLYVGLPWLLSMSSLLPPVLEECHWLDRGHSGLAGVCRWRRGT